MVYIPLFISKKCCILLVELVNFFLHFWYLCSNISDLGPENYINKHLLNCDFSWRKRHLIILYTDRCRRWGWHLYSESCHTVATWQSFSVIFNNLLHLFDFVSNGQSNCNHLIIEGVVKIHICILYFSEFLQFDLLV